MDRECVWKHENDESGYYETACGHAWQFTEGNLKDNRVVYCPYCGGLIQEER